MIATSIALMGLQANAVRLNASASNVANSNTTGKVEPAAAGAAVNTGYTPLVVWQAALPGGGTEAVAMAKSPGTTPVHDPESPDADGDGMVAMPNVDPAAETVAQIQAASAYRANLSVMRTAGRMQDSLLDLRA